MGSKGNSKTGTRQRSPKEKDFSFFKLVVISVILSQSQFQSKILKYKDPREMYERANGLNFYQYHQWVTEDIMRIL